MSKNKCKLVMVNSFKGGTGKTTMALSYCIHNWKTGTGYRNIYFIDIDILGTSLAYTLFEEDQTPSYFDECSTGKLLDARTHIKLPEDEGKGDVYAVLLNPVAERSGGYHEYSRLRSHVASSHAIFQQNLREFIVECMKMGDSLFVVDCAPGLARMEQRLLKMFYDIDGLEVEEIYVSTFDASQIRKTIECLNENQDWLHREKRKASLVLNDLYNFVGLFESDKDIKFSWFDVLEDVWEKLDDKDNMTIRYKCYEGEQLKSGVWKHESHISNCTPNYMLRKEFFEGYKGPADKGEKSKDE